MTLIPNDWPSWLVLVILALAFEHLAIKLFHVTKSKVSKIWDEYSLREPLGEGSIDRARDRKKKLEEELDNVRKYNGNPVVLSTYMAGETLRILTHIAIAGILVALATATTLLPVPIESTELIGFKMQAAFQTTASLLAALIFLRAVIFGWVACQQRDNIIEFVGFEKKLGEKIKDLERKIRDFEEKHKQQPQTTSQITS